MNYFVPTSAAKNAANHTGKRKKKKNNKNLKHFIKTFCKNEGLCKDPISTNKKKNH